MRLALVCGDGVPVSGLLTVFRTVVELGARLGCLDRPIPADLGYSWRPDKPAFYPDGGPQPDHPHWLEATTATPVADTRHLAAELDTIRRLVAIADTLDPEANRDLTRRVEQVAAPYERHFTAWLDDNDVDWVCAVNMTLSDAVPVTLALHRAGARHFADRPGGILFWDHDLYGSYAVHEGPTRIYPTRPNWFTPLPADRTRHRWAVVTDALAAETTVYPTPLTAKTVPNILPTVPATLDERHHEFLRQLGIRLDQPILLCPVRMFRVKGVEIAVELLAHTRHAAAARGEPEPRLLVFGALGEDPEYTAHVQQTVAATGTADAVHFLDGVPLTSHRDTSGRWRLDETDLLAICAASHGGVVFTPNRPDVESVGLGPALAAIARVPCASTAYTALDDIYGTDLTQVRVDPAELGEAGRTFARMLADHRRADAGLTTALARNRQLVLDRFPVDPWRSLLLDMATTAADRKVP